MTDTTCPPSAPPRRILSVWLSWLAVDRWRLAEGCTPGEGADAFPTVLTADAAHGPRIEAANRAALDAGARPGMRLADARALCPQIVTAMHDAAGDAAFLAQLALWAQRWGPWSAIDPPGGLLVDITGVAHLFSGEEALLADMAAAFAGRGLTVRLAAAPTAGAAWALAHYGAKQTAHDDDMLETLAPLPVAALRLDSDVLTVLRRLGLGRIGDLDRIGRDALMRRFRNRKRVAANPLLRMDQLLGRLPEPLVPVHRPQVPQAQRRLLEPIRHRALLDQVLADLARDLKQVLEAQGKGARRLELALWRVDGEVLLRHLEMSAATRDPAHIVRLFAQRLDDVDAGFGIETVRLRAERNEPLALVQSDIEAPTGRDGTSLAVFIDRLTARLGEGVVRRPVLHPSHIPERAQRWSPALAAEPASQEVLCFHARPLKLLDRAERIEVLYATPDGHPRSFRWRGSVHEVVRVEGPERIAPEWWRERSSVRLRDYYRIEDREGRRYWIYRHGLIGDGRGGLPDWYLQGLCA